MVNGVLVMQVISFFYICDVFWCIVEILKVIGFWYVLFYYIYVFFFGDWGFVLAGVQLFVIMFFIIGLFVCYLDVEVVEAMFYFFDDFVCFFGLEFNCLDQFVLLDYYLEDWEKWSWEVVVE